MTVQYYLREESDGDETTFCYAKHEYPDKGKPQVTILVPEDFDTRISDIAAIDGVLSAQKIDGNKILVKWDMQKRIAAKDSTENIFKIIEEYRLMGTDGGIPK